MSDSKQPATMPGQQTRSTNRPQGVSSLFIPLNKLNASQPPRRTLRLLITFASIAVLISSLLILNHFFLGQPARTVSISPTSTGALPASANNLIRQENAQVGSQNWQIINGSLHGEIQAYASTDSLMPGQSISLHVSTTAPSFTIEVFRLGYYGGLGAREVYSHPHVPGISQGYYPDPNPQPLPTQPPQAPAPINCPTCKLDPTTHEVTANWQVNTPLDTITFGASWVSGVYFIRLTDDAKHTQWGIPVVLRDDTAPAAAVMAIPFNTYQAYNYWGGTSLYADYTIKPLALKRAFAVSYDRPYAAGYGVQFLFWWTYQMVKFVEGEGIDVRYTTDNALDKGYTKLADYKAFIIPGHSEYWSFPMRQSLQQAIANNKLSIGFFSANSIYWQVRMSADGRTVVCYKDDPKPPYYDPYNTPGNPNRYLTTTLWRWNPLNEPEDQILKEMYGLDNAYGSSGGPIQNLKLINTNFWAFSGTGLKDGAIIHGVLGNEVDVLHSDGSWGPNDHVTLLAQSPYTGEYGRQWTQTTTLDDIANAQGMLTHQIIFDAGAIYWPQVLTAASSDGVALRQITYNVLYAMIYRTTKIPPIPQRDITL